MRNKINVEPVVNKSKYNYKIAKRFKIKRKKNSCESLEESNIFKQDNSKKTVKALTKIFIIRRKLNI